MGFYFALSLASRTDLVASTCDCIETCPFSDRLASRIQSMPNYLVIFSYTLRVLAVSNDVVVPILF